MLEELAIIVVRGIGLGAIYSLIAISFNIVFISSGVLNFAQGAMIVLGGATAYFFSEMLGVVAISTWIALLPAAAVSIGVLLAVQGYVTLLPMRHSSDDHSWLITTLAVSIIIGAILLLTQGPNALSVRSAFASFDFLGTRVPTPYALVFGLAVLWYVLLRLFMSRTLTGLAISALWQNPDAARATGLPVERLQVLAFFISGLIVGTAGYVAAPLIQISASSSIRYALAGFVTLVVGGMGSNLGAMIAGPLVGVVAMVATYRVGAEYQSLFSLIILVGVLLIRPRGLLGRTSIRRV